MKVSRYSKGCYIITLHGHSFTIERLGNATEYWILYNAKQTEINQFETKSGALELLREWTPERTEIEARKECYTYA